MQIHQEVKESDHAREEPTKVTHGDGKAEPKRQPAPKKAERIRKYTSTDPKRPARRKSPSPKPISRTPSPPVPSSPRQRKRPGGAARISNAERDAVRQRQLERERHLESRTKAEVAARGVHDVVTQHYNAVPQRGKEWRKTDSKIKGLRSFNNWVKSALIQKFSTREDYAPGASERNNYYADQVGGDEGDRGGLLVLDIGCGKGGDLQKWQQAPQKVELYVGVDPAEVSIEQARDRYAGMKRGGRGGNRARRQDLFEGEFFVKDCFAEWLGDLPLIQEVGIDGIGPEGSRFSQRWGGGGFDVVSMMFCMHYAFENEQKARGMLRNVAGSLKKGGRFIGVIPNSDVLSEKVEEFHKRNEKPQVDLDDDWDPEKSLDVPEKVENGEDGEVKDESLEWGNGIFRVKFPGQTPKDGVFRPPFGWKYFYFLEEAVSEVPEYVVPWEAFRA